MITLCKLSVKALLALALSCDMVSSTCSASLVAATNGAPTVSSGILSAVIVATDAASNSKSAYAIPSTTGTIGNFESLVNFGTIPLASETIKVTKISGIQSGTVTMQYCTGTWTESTGVCSTGGTTFLTVAAGTASGSALVALALAPGATRRLRLLDSTAARSVQISVTVTTSNDVATITNS
jgi:hypothetical protein